MKCPYCGNVHPDVAQYCPITGNSLESSKSSFDECSNCGGVIPPGAEFCPSCGAPTKIVTDVKQPSIPTTAQLRSCPSCGTQVPRDAEFCPKCGTVIINTAPGVSDGFQIVEYIRQHVRLLGGIAGILLVAVLLIVFLPRIWSTLGTGSVSNTDPTSSPFVQATNGSTSSQSDIDLSPSQNSNLNSATDTPTRIISATKKPTRTELPRKVCPGAPPIRVEIGDDAIVTYNCGDHVLMRLNPVVATNAEQYLYAGDRLKIIDGPRCSNDVTFFLVEAPKYSKTGWVAEALADSDTYCVDLVP